MSSNGHEYQPVVEDGGPSEIGVGVLDDRVVIRLAEPMDLLGMTPEEAVHIAMALMRAAVQIKPELGEGLPA